MVSVCFKCEGRTSTCHKDCKVYAAWAAENEKRRKKARADTVYTAAAGAQVTKNIKFMKDVKGKVRRT